MSSLKALFLVFSCHLIWGLQPIYFKLLKASSYEVLALRISFSSLLLFIFVLLTKRYKLVLFYLKDKRIFTHLFCAGLLISLNWLVYIWALLNNNILETSIGYFTGPILSIFLAILFLKEKQSKFSKIAIFLATLALFNELFWLGRLPFIAVILPLTFSIYVIIKKKINVEAFEGLFVETLCMVPISLAYIFYLKAQGNLDFALDLNGFLLGFTGFITVLPLVLFNLATRYVRVSTLGFLGYFSPFLLAFLAVCVYKEPFASYRLISFALIIIGLSFISYESIKKEQERK